MSEKVYHLYLKTMLPEAEVYQKSCPECKAFSEIYGDPYYITFRRCSAKGCNGYIECEGSHARVEYPSGVKQMTAIMLLPYEERMKHIVERAQRRSELYDEIYQRKDKGNE